MRHRTPEERAARAISFDADPALYDRARPTYPPELFDSLWQLGELGDAPTVVEIGCGTGQSTRDLARRGAHVTAVEFGPNMAAFARVKLAEFPQVVVVNSRFEDWDPGRARHDLVYASSSWHWVDPDVRYAKAASVLRPGGPLAIVSSDHVYPAGYDRTFDAIQEVYREVTGSSVPWPPPQPESIPDEHDDMAASGWFEDVHVSRHMWHFERDADGFIELLATFSDNLVRDPEQRARLFAGIHRLIAGSPTGTIRKDMQSILRVGRVSG